MFEARVFDSLETIYDLFTQPTCNKREKTSSRARYYVSVIFLHLSVVNQLVQRRGPHKQQYKKALIYCHQKRPVSCCCMAFSADFCWLQSKFVTLTLSPENPTTSSSRRILVGSVESNRLNVPTPRCVPDSNCALMRSSLPAQIFDFSKRSHSLKFSLSLDNYCRSGYGIAAYDHQSLSDQHASKTLSCSQKRRH